MSDKFKVMVLVDYPEYREIGETETFEDAIEMISKHYLGVQLEEVNKNNWPYAELYQYASVGANVGSCVLGKIVCQWDVTPERKAEVRAAITKFYKERIAALKKDIEWFEKRMNEELTTLDAQ